jgi:hypothetical protein
MMLLLGAAAAAAAVAGVPGWLLRLACNERMKEEFDTLHEAVLEMLKVIHAAHHAIGRFAKYMCSWIH